MRNELIADLMSRTVFMKKVGTGIKKIKRNCEKNKNKVEFKLAENDFFVILKSEPISEGVSEGVNVLVNYIKLNPGKRVPNFVEALNIPEKTIERWIKLLKEKRLIIFKGNPKKGGYWEMRNEK